MSYQFYSECDYDPKTGKIKSEYPTFCDPNLIRDMEEEIATKEIALATGQVPKGYEPDYRDTLSRLKEQYNKMLDMTRIEDAKNDKGKLGTIVNKIGKLITSELPKQAQCDRNLVDPSLEYRKLTEHRYKIEDEEMSEVAKACNVPIVDGKINGYGLHKIWKIGSKYLGEYANIESLRK